ncbi:hypothetical protein ACWC9S_20625 [Streptomyces xiamenensis]
MRSVSTTVHRIDEDPDLPDDTEPDGSADLADPAEPADIWAVRVSCPDCGHPVALAERAQTLPEHAWCPTTWQPFGLTVCTGSGRRVAGDGAVVFLPVEPLIGDPAPAGLPEGLDWRLQPFSHAADTAARAGRTTGLRQAA